MQQRDRPLQELCIGQQWREPERLRLRYCARTCGDRADKIPGEEGQCGCARLRLGPRDSTLVRLSQQGIEPAPTLGRSATDPPEPPQRAGERQPQFPVATSIDAPVQGMPDIIDLAIQACEPARLLGPP